MIPHHQGAIDMAAYLENAKHPELQKLGKEIITAQSKEIEQMQNWLKEWGYSNAANPSTNMYMMPHGTMMHN